MSSYIDLHPKTAYVQTSDIKKVGNFCAIKSREDVSLNVTESVNIVLYI